MRSRLVPPPLLASVLFALQHGSGIFDFRPKTARLALRVLSTADRLYSRWNDRFALVSSSFSPQLSPAERQDACGAITAAEM